MIPIDENGGHFDYAVCDKNGLFGNCKHTKMVRDVYDLGNKDFLKQLQVMDFVLMKRPKPASP